MEQSLLRNRWLNNDSLWGDAPRDDADKGMLRGVKRRSKPNEHIGSFRGDGTHCEATNQNRIGTFLRSSTQITASIAIIAESVLTKCSTMVRIWESGAGQPPPLSVPPGSEKFNK